jgi:hypothetical protein
MSRCFSDFSGGCLVQEPTMGVPGADDIMLNYQSTSFHDALYLRQVLGLRPAPEFDAWLEKIGVTQGQRLREIDDRHALVSEVKQTFTNWPWISACRPLPPLAQSETAGRCRFVTGHWSRT